MAVLNSNSGNKWKKKKKMIFTASEFLLAILLLIYFMHSGTNASKTWKIRVILFDKKKKSEPKWS